MNSFHFIGALTTAFIHGFVVLAILAFSNIGGGTGEPVLKMNTIEAALAYKSTKKTKQPQKRRRRPKRKAQPKGVSRDDKKIVEPKKQPETEREEDYAAQFEKFKRQREQEEEDAEEDDIEEGEELPTNPGGQFDGSRYGDAEQHKGHKYIRDLLEDFRAVYAVPTLEKGKGAAIGCVHLVASGKIDKTKFHESSKNANIDRAVKLALKKLQKKRNKKPVPVPTELLQITSEWTCFRPSQ